MTISSRLCCLPQLARYIHLSLQRQVKTLHHQVPVNPLEHHLAPVIAECILEQTERPHSGEREFSGQRLHLIIEVKEDGLFKPRSQKTGGMAVKTRQCFMTVYLS